MREDIGSFTVNAVEAEEIAAQRARQGWHVFRLPPHIASKDNFFEAVRQTLPLDPELHSNRSWDALADSLWAGLDGLKIERIVIIWPDTFEMKMHSPKDHAIAEAILSELPISLGNWEATDGTPKQVLVLRVD